MRASSHNHSASNKQIIVPVESDARDDSLLLSPFLSIILKSNPQFRGVPSALLLQPAAAARIDAKSGEGSLLRDGCHS